MNNIKCSIITVSFNSEKTIEKTIQSVLNQTYQNIEYIIIDGNSNDNTVEIIKSYEAKFNGRLKWISEPDKGIYYAMNKGIKLATGELIGIINSDDYYENNAIESAIACMTEQPLQVLYGKVRHINTDGTSVVSHSSHEELATKMIDHPGCFVTKSIYDKYGNFDTNYVAVADYDFMLRMSEKEDVVFVPVEDVVANFLQGGMSASDKAYVDLIKLRCNRGEVSKAKYYYNKMLLKCIQIKRALCSK